MIFREDEAELGSNWYCFITNKKGDWLINVWDRDPIYSLLDLIEIKTAPDMISMYGTGYSENYEDRRGEFRWRVFSNFKVMNLSLMP